MPKITFEGMTADEIVALPDEHLDELVFVEDAIVIEVGSSKILGSFRIADSRLILELAQIDGGGEGVLPAIGALAQRVARLRELQAIEWQVHAINCAEPNLKLRRLLLRRDFEITSVKGVGDVYRKVDSVQAPAA